MDRSTTMMMESVPLTRSLPRLGKLKVRRTTLKAFANSSPGFALKPWVQKTRKKFFATLKPTNGDATLSELRLLEINACSPGLPKRNPGLQLANAFSVVRRTLSCHTISTALGTDSITGFDQLETHFQVRCNTLC